MTDVAGHLRSQERSTLQDDDGSLLDLPPRTPRAVVLVASRPSLVPPLRDTGADPTIIGAQHLQHIGLFIQDLQPPPQTPTYAAGDSPMKLAVGSVQVETTRDSVPLKCRGVRVKQYERLRVFLCLLKWHTHSPQLLIHFIFLVVWLETLCFPGVSRGYGRKVEDVG